VEAEVIFGLRRLALIFDVTANQASQIVSANPDLVAVTSVGECYSIVNMNGMHHHKYRRV
jgi:hypothetical protein